MSTITTRKLTCFIFISILSNILMFFHTRRIISTYLIGCDDEQFQCWFEKKQILNENIARVCSKYRIEVEANNSRGARFLQHGQLVNCVNPKVCQPIRISLLHSMSRFDSRNCSTSTQHFVPQP